MPGEILIKFKDGATDAQLQDVVRRAGVSSIIRQIRTQAMKDRRDNGITHAATTRNVDDAIRDLRNHPAVEYAQPNWIYHHQTSPSDPYYNNGSLWGIYGASTTPASEFGSGAAAAWDGVTSTETVYIGIVDEGIQYNHPDLAANVWKNPGEYGKKYRVDDDANGYVDDIYGWNAINNNGTIYNATYDDHGTHVAGTIGAVANSTGVIGVAGNKNVRLIAGKFLGPNGGTTADAIEIIDYMIALKTHNLLNIVALNNSWGGGGFDAALRDAIVRAAEQNILFVVAAGNGDSANVAIDTVVTPAYPACYDTTAEAGYNSVISVTAIDANGALPGWANYGATTIDLGAPGVDILSTLNNSTYGYGSGTSMATPHVTGAIALYAIQYPTATAAEIRTALLGSTTPTPSLSGKTVTGGRLAVENFLMPPPTTAPSSPSDLTTTAISATEIKLNWTDNSDNETSFEIVRTDGAQVTKTFTVGANVKTYTDTGLMPNATYEYTITARNIIGSSASVGPVSATTQYVEPAVVTPMGSDLATHGDWVGKYGDQCYDIVAYKNFTTATITPSGALNANWAASTSDPRGLLKPDKSDSFASCYYSGPPYNTVGNSFTLDVNPNDDQPHIVSLYCVDWDTTTRDQTVEVIDYNYKKVIDTRNVSSFAGGQYLVWNIKGHVTFKITNNSVNSANAVVSGIFIGDPNYTPPTPPTPPAAPSNLSATAVSKSQINLTWMDNSDNETGFKIERSKSSTTGFTQIGTAAANVKTFSDTGLSANTTYYYHVRATKDSVDSEYSNTSSAKTLRK